MRDRLITTSRGMDAIFSKSMKFAIKNGLNSCINLLHGFVRCGIYACVMYVFPLGGKLSYFPHAITICNKWSNQIVSFECNAVKPRLHGHRFASLGLTKRIKIPHSNYFFSRLIDRLAAV